MDNFSSLAIMEDVKFSIQKAQESLTRKLMIGLHPLMIWKKNKFLCHDVMRWVD